MADSNREHKRDLTDIRPDLVSLVDLPANGEPFFIMKRSPDGGTMATEKKIRKQDDEKKPEDEGNAALPGDVRSEMSALIKALADQTTGLVSALKEMSTVDDGDAVTPSVVASKIMSIHNSLSAMLGKAVVDGEEEEKSIESMLKSSNEFADATMITSSRDKMVAVLSSVAERLAAIVDALAGEDAMDPSEDLMGILNDIVSLTEQFPPASEDEEEENPEDEEEDEKMTASRLARLRKASSRLTELAQGFAEVSVEFAKALEDEESEGEDMADESKKKVDGEAPVEKNADAPDPVMAAIEGLKKSIDDGIGEVKKTVEDLTKRIDSTDEKVEKMGRAREPADGGGPDESVKKTEGGGDGGGGESLFSDIMPDNLRGTVSRT